MHPTRNTRGPCGQNGPDLNSGANASGMGPKPDKGQPISGITWQLQWSGKDR